MGNFEMWILSFLVFYFYLLENETRGIRSDTADGSVDVILMKWTKSLLSKYWILVCCGAFLLVGLQNDVSLYQIGYMAIFLFLFICYQVGPRVLRFA